MRSCAVRLALIVSAIGNAYAAGPVIASATLNPIDAGGPFFPLTITGSGFVNGSEARWGKTVLSTVFVDSGKLIASVTPDLRLISDNYPLTVLNPNLAVSNTYQMIVLPVMGGVTPWAVRAGGPGVSVQVKGIGFQSRFNVQLSSPSGPVNITPTFVDSFTLNADLPASVLAESRTATIQVVDPKTGNASATSALEIRGVPAITALSPNPVDAGGGYFLLHVNGTGFASGDKVLWPGGAELGTTYVSDTELQVAITPELRPLSGTFNLTVSDPTTSVTSNAFGFVISPVLFGIAPSLAAAGGPDLTVTASGAGFTRSSAIALMVAGQPSVLKTAYIDSGTLTAIVPANAIRSPGAIAVEVVDTAGAGRSLPQTLTISQRIPVLSSLSPSVVSAGLSGFSLTVNGSNFVSGAAVKWNGATLPTTFLTATQVTAAVAAPLVQTQGAASVAVMNPGGDPSNTLTVTIQQPAPSLSSFTPASAIAGGAGLTLTVTAANCGGGCAVQWNGAPLSTSVVSATQVTAIVPAALMASPGNVSLRLVNANGAASNTVTFLLYPAAAAIASLNPTSAIQGASFVLTVTGTNFAAGAAIQWNGTTLATTFVSQSQLTATVPSNLLEGTTSAAITVVNPGGAISNAIPIAVQPLGPSLGNIAPAAVTAGGAAFQLTVNGANFAANCVVRWNGSPLYTTFAGATQVTAAVSSDRIAAGGAAVITLANPNGSVSNALTLPIETPAPVIDAVSPSSSPAGATALTLTVTGSGYLASSKVLWNATTLDTRYMSGAQLSAEVPPELLAASGLVGLAVSTPGAKISNTVSFTIGAPLPAIASGGIVNAASGLPGAAPGSLISIFGANLAPADAAAATMPLESSLEGTSVSIGGIPAPLLFVSSGQINAQVPFEIPPGPSKIVVQTAAGKSLPASFDVAALAPGILSLVLNAGDGSMNSESSPIRPGQYLTVWVTGQGAVSPAIATGAAAPSDPFSMPGAGVQAQLGGLDATVAFAGMAPGLAGLLQVNLIVPDLPAGKQQLVVAVGGVQSNNVPVWIALP